MSDELAAASRSAWTSWSSPRGSRRRASGAYSATRTCSSSAARVLSDPARRALQGPLRPDRRRRVPGHQPRPDALRRAPRRWRPLPGGRRRRRPAEHLRLHWSGGQEHPALRARGRPLRREPTYKLTTNFRSGRTILELANHIARAVHPENSPDEPKVLAPAPTPRKARSPPSSPPPTRRRPGR